MSLQKLCYLVYEKNKLGIERRRTRHKLYRLNTIKRARNIYRGKIIPSRWEHSNPTKIPQKWHDMKEQDFRVVYMRAELAFNTVNLKIAEHTQEHSLETRQLSKKLGTRIAYGNDNIIECIHTNKDEEIGYTSSLGIDQIEQEASKHEFELIFLQRH